MEMKAVLIEAECSSPDSKGLELKGKYTKKSVMHGLCNDRYKVIFPASHWPEQIVLLSEQIMLIGEHLARRHYVILKLPGVRLQ